MQYRPEIDGLRTIAVVPVILFHAGFGGFSGGFVGVDVFFVISGYLITTILINELQQNDFSLLRFYERRARRILPALFLVMGASIPFAWFWMLPRQYDDFAESLVAVVLFISNILFWQEDDYFGAAAELKPLLHTWSLAVEEQYYLLFPLFLLLFWRLGKKGLLWLILGVALISLAMTEWGWRYQASANFYLAPTRAWELLAGSICAFILIETPKKPLGWAAGLGLGLILSSIALFDHMTPFPSLYALIPVLGTVLIVLFAHPGTWVAGLLSIKPMVGIGLISYSAYLWHQPLFAFARIRFFVEAGTVSMGILSLVALFLAYLTWQFVEVPIRARRIPVLASRKGIFLASGVIGSAFVVFGLFSSNETYALSRLDARQQKILSFLSFNETPEYFETYRNPDCFYGPKQNSFAAFNKEKCLEMRTDRPNVLLLGDSHAAHLWHGLTVAFPKINFLQATASGCLPMQPLKGAVRCTDMVSYIWQDFLPDHKIDAIILAGRWDHDDLVRVPSTLTSLGRFTDRLIVIGPVVEYQPALPLILAQVDDQSASSHARRFTDRDRPTVSDAIASEVALMGASFVDIASQQCSEAACLVTSQTGEPMSWDYGHFTPSGAVTIMSRLRDAGLLTVEMMSD